MTSPPVITFKYWSPREKNCKGHSYGKKTKGNLDVGILDNNLFFINSEKEALRRIQTVIKYHQYLSKCTMTINY